MGDGDSMVGSIWCRGYRVHMKPDVRNINLKLEFRQAIGLTIELFFMNSSTRPRVR